MKKNTVLIISSLLFVAFQSKAQDVHFSQFYNAPLSLNPASTGVFNGDYRAVLNYKSQWRQMSETPHFNTYNTGAFSFDAGLFKEKWKNSHLGLGILMFSDRAGDSKMGIIQGSISLSSVVYLDANNNLAAGLQAGVNQRKVDYTNLKWDNQYNGLYYDSKLSPRENLSVDNTIRADFSTGILWNYSKGEMYATANDAIRANAGLSMSHVNKPNQSFFEIKDKLYSKYVLHGGFYKGLKNTNTSIVPGFSMFVQGKTKEILLGMLMKYNLKDASKYTGNIKSSAIFFGGYYRVGDAIIVCAQFEIDKYFIGISYDVNVSRLTSATSGLGGPEISIRFINSKSGNIAMRRNG